MENNKYNSIKNIVLIVTGIITVIAILAGVYMHIIRRVPAVSVKDLGNSVTNEVVIDNKVTSICIDMDICDLSFQNGNQVKVEYTLPEKLIPDIEVKDDVLYIESRRNVNVGLDGLNSSNYTVVVTIPSDMDLEDFEAVISLGDIDISDIKCKSFSVSADCGDIDINDIDTETFEVSADLGDIKIEDISCAEDFSVSANAGDLDVKNINAYTVDVTVDMGDVDFDDVVFDNGTFDTDMGDIKLEGEFKQVSLGCSLGSVDVTSKNPDANIDTSVDLGSVKVNGKTIK